MNKTKSYQWTDECEALMADLQLHLYELYRWFVETDVDAKVEDTYPIQDAIFNDAEAVVDLYPDGHTVADIVWSGWIDAKARIDETTHGGDDLRYIEFCVVGLILQYLEYEGTLNQNQWIMLNELNTLLDNVAD